jgi:hypothetical protein
MPLVAHNQAVSQPNCAPRAFGSGRFMRDEDDSHASGSVQLLQQPHNLLAGSRIERTRWLIGQDEQRIRYERAGDRHPL